MMLVPAFIFSALVGPYLHYVRQCRNRHRLFANLFRTGGKWEVRFESESLQATAYNEVGLIQAGTVLREDLQIASLGIEGRGLSKYHYPSARWHHMWSDKDSRYIEFIAAFAPDSEILETFVNSCEGDSSFQRIYLDHASVEKKKYRLASYDDAHGCWQHITNIEYSQLK